MPGHFITENVVSRRNPLRETAQRRGWIGSNILLDRVPEVGKIPLVEGGRIVSPQLVRQTFASTAFFQNIKAEDRGWLAEVLSCIDRLDSSTGEPFTLGQVYAFESHLQALHPENHNVKPKIRQQLQLLRKKGLVEFQGRGRYVKVHSPTS